ncbi:MAG: hypothetical protein J3Q66DRAFT_340879 [Benniella sp.]|nr:MAG: hypothetical protein J3Q66DRAFT_340879 [Benniella sp.]
MRAGSSETMTGTSPGSGGRLGLANGSTSIEQGRNSSKRAAQNRAAQRAFRLRKDMYVRELERKAELLQQAEGRVMELSARNRELETALAIAQGRVLSPTSTASSPQQPPQPQSPQHTPTATHLDPEQETREPMERERERHCEEKGAPVGPRETLDEHEGHGNPSGRLALNRNPSLPQLRHAYNGSLQSQQTHQRYSDADGSGRLLHDRASESTLNQSLKGVRTDPDEIKAEGWSVMHDVERESLDSRAEHHQPASQGFRHSNNSAHPEHSNAPPLNKRPPPYPISTASTRTGSVGVPTSVYPNPSLNRPRSYQMDQDGTKLPAPVANSTSSPGPKALGGMATATSPPSQKGGYIDRHLGVTRADVDRKYEDQPGAGSGYDSIRKRSSDGSMWVGGKSTESLRSGFSNLGFQGEIRKQASWSSFPVTKNTGGFGSLALPSASVMKTPSDRGSIPSTSLGDMNADMEMQEPFHHHQPQPQQRHLHHRASTGSVPGRDRDRRFSGGNRMTPRTESSEMISSDPRSGSGVTSLTSQMVHHQQQSFSSTEQQHQRQHPPRYPQSSEQDHSPGMYGSSPHNQSRLSSQYRPAHGQGMHEFSQPRNLGDKFGRSYNDMNSSDMEAAYEFPRKSSNSSSSFGGSGNGYNNEFSMGSP